MSEALSLESGTAIRSLSGFSMYDERKGSVYESSQLLSTCSALIVSAPVSWYHDDCSKRS
jgi:hypothetical protein